MSAPPTQCLPGYTAQIRGKPPNITVSCVKIPPPQPAPNNPNPNCQTDPFGCQAPPAAKMTHASSPRNKPAPVADTSTSMPPSSSSSPPPPDPLAFLETNCIPQIPIPCWGLIAGAVIGLIVILKVR